MYEVIGCTNNDGTVSYVICSARQQLFYAKHLHYAIVISSDTNSATKSVMLIIFMFLVLDSRSKPDLELYYLKEIAPK